jgi:SAM-dependent methyltransferase
MTTKSYVDINAETIDHWVDEGWEWGVPTDHERFVRAQNGDWEVGLTPIKRVPKEWFGELTGKKLLGLASGGGQQMPVFVAAGADCTVLDYSDRQLANEKLVAEREGYEIEIVKADMTKRLPFDDESFDIIFHPVSNCYIEDVQHVWNECYRVLRRGGRLIAGMDNGINYLFDEDMATGTPDNLVVVNKLPFNPLKDPKIYEKCVREDWGIQFSHTFEEQVGGQLRAGLTLKNLYEDYNNEGALKDYIPTYIATLAIK